MHLTTLDQHRQVYAGGLRPAQVMSSCYRHLDAAADPGNFITFVPEREAMEAAEALGPFDPSKALWGVPFAVKDNIDAAGLPTTSACPAFAYRPAASAPAVRRLREAGPS